MEPAHLSKEMWTLNLALTVISEKLFFFLAPRFLLSNLGVYAELLFSRVIGGVFKVLSFLSL